MIEKDKKVLRKILNDMECGLFYGKYDAKNGDEHFMFGIELVMEYLYGLLSEEELDNFKTTFCKNMIDSENKK